MATKTPEWLRPGERILFYGEQDWPQRRLRFVFVAFLIAGALSASLTVWAYEYSTLRRLIYDSAGDGFYGALVLFFLVSRRVEIVFTGERMIVREGGVFLRHLQEVAMTDIGKVTGADSGDDALTLELKDGQSLEIKELPKLGAIREILENSIRAT